MYLKEIASYGQKIHQGSNHSLQEASEKQSRQGQSSEIHQNEAIADLPSSSFPPKKARVGKNRVQTTPGEDGGECRPQCRCKKSHCAKNYCQCFAAGMLCGAKCNCYDCQNTKNYVTSSISKRKSRAGFKGCLCTRSNCQKNYCLCYSNGEKCKLQCKCINCLNQHPTSKQPKEQSLLQNMEEDFSVKTEEKKESDPQFQQKLNLHLEERMSSYNYQKEKAIWDFLIDE